MKCVREDLVSQTLTVHYLNDGNCLMRLLIRKQEFMIPIILILKCLMDAPDILIYNRIVRGNLKNTKLRECVEVVLAEGKQYSFSKRSQYLDLLGSRFRGLLGLSENKNLTDEEVGQIFINDYIMIHLKDNSEKFSMLCILIEKLYLLSFGEIKPDNMDSPLNHEILLSGHLYAMVLKEKLEEVLGLLRLKLNKSMSKVQETSKIRDIAFIKKMIDSNSQLGKRMEHFLATGNLISQTGLDLMQMGGYSIIAEKLNNMRYIAHFRSVHRGQFFAEMKTTTPRKLLPESWGFVCPVHTPDGAPCGLLNHISQGCEIIATQESVNTTGLLATLSNLGLIPVSHDLNYHAGHDTLPVVLDGTVVGFINKSLVKNFIPGLRKYKVLGQKDIPKNLEIGYIPAAHEGINLQYPGIFLFTCIARMTRKVKNLSLGKEEYIGPLEQIYLNIACLPEDIKPETTHQEIDPIKILSLIASLTPFCDYNQSPRNMYQCQMAKQTMGTPYFNYPYRMDNKTFRVLFPQSPLVRTSIYEKYGFDSNPSGTNAVVAVLAYTGYDMEDAMIINKSAYERGFGHGTVYKVVTKKLNENQTRHTGSKITARYRLLNLNNDEDKQLIKNSLSTKGKVYPDHLGKDGLPLIGTYLQSGMPEFVFVDIVKSQLVTAFYKDSENAFVDEVFVAYGNSNEEICLTFKFRIKRNPVIGDKFSSRHGQKGVLANLWPQENMPFTESGITPDVLINPHAFPSRMTIGMLIESLAGKSGSLHGKFQEFSAFQQFEDDDAIGYFGKELLDKGYNYCGNEVMYSGVSGVQLKADIYIGVVYYQRLRHMVNDKAQARSTGKIDVLTRQPVKGRKNQGGIRFGEMERDSLLSHGVSYCLQDRLFNCSDYSEGYICTKCGELLAAIKSKALAQKPDILGQGKSENIMTESYYCRNCKQENTIVKVAIPYVLRYLTNELAAMNIKLTFSVK
jgi:DNA-directed RNA polymerase I subunit RPA2